MATILHGCQHEKGGEEFSGFVVSGGEAAKLFEPVKHPLDAFRSLQARKSQAAGMTGLIPCISIS